jgi:tyrosyl-tRNA synthetase
MNADQKFELITRDTEEVLTPEDLKTLLTHNIPLTHYIGFEISGRPHIGSGLMTGAKIADFQKAGVHCTIYLATYHAWINNKLGGDLTFITKAATYFAECLKASIDVMGGDSTKVEFIDGQQLYHHNDEYWKLVLEISKNITLKRNLRAISIAGREEHDDVPMALLIYPPMQVADIFALNVNLAHAGTDQRKAQVIAREVAPKITTKPLLHDGKPYKPIAIHHHLLPGLAKPPVWPLPEGSKHDILTQMKMSKSIKGSAIFVDDTPEDIKACLTSAFCPEGETSYNPVLDWTKHLVFRDGPFTIQRPAKFGGPLTFQTYPELEHAFLDKKIHPLDLKNAIAHWLTTKLEPVRARLADKKFIQLRKEIDEALTR